MKELGLIAFLALIALGFYLVMLAATGHLH